MLCTVFLFSNTREVRNGAVKFGTFVVRSRKRGLALRLGYVFANKFGKPLCSQHFFQLSQRLGNAVVNDCSLYAVLQQRFKGLILIGPHPDAPALHRLIAGDFRAGQDCFKGQVLELLVPLHETAALL